MTQMNFCNQCGGRLTIKTPDGDTLPRYVCLSCGSIHYQNPKVVAGCLPVWENKVLLCRRSIEPRLGLWTLPAGFMENGETLAGAAMRETVEEANAHVSIASLFTLFNLPHINQVYVMFRAQLLDMDFSPGDESSEVELFTEEQIPWDKIAFATIRETLNLYFSDRLSGQYGVHMGDIIKPQGVNGARLARLENHHLQN